MHNPRTGFEMNRNLIQSQSVDSSVNLSKYTNSMQCWIGIVCTLRQPCIHYSTYKASADTVLHKYALVNTHDWCSWKNFHCHVCILHASFWFRCQKLYLYVQNRVQYMYFFLNTHAFHCYSTIYRIVLTISLSFLFMSTHFMIMFFAFLPGNSLIYCTTVKI